MIGASFGCDQTFDNLLVGVVAEGNLFLPETRSELSGADPWSNVLTIQNTYNADLALRFGRIFDNTLIFGKIGVGVAAFKYSSVYQIYSVNGFTNVSGVNIPNWIAHLWQADPSYRTLIAPVLGVGMEHKLDEHWSLTAGLDVLYFRNQAANMTVTQSAGHDYMHLNTNGTAPGLANYTVGDPYHYSASVLQTNISIGVNRRF
jgi:hypothetical protein